MPVLPPVLSWAVLTGIVAALAYVLLWRKVVGKRNPAYLAHCEYWVYTPQESLPKQEVMMDRMISANPHNRPGRPCIGAREGLLFSDIRLHIALARRNRNPLVFRPDLFQEHTEPDAETLSRLSKAKSLIKVRYLSNVELKDTRHLQFLPHLADAVSELTDGLLVYDVVCEQIHTAEEFRDELAANGNAERPEMHVRVLWHVDDDGETGYATTQGMRKLGLPELKTDPVAPDQQVLVTGLLHRTAHQVFRSPKIEEPIEYEEFGDTFIIELIAEKGLDTRVTIKRRRGA